MNKNTRTDKVTIHNADLGWTPRPHKGHPQNCPCYSCEAAAKWTAWYMKNRNGR